MSRKRTRHRWRASLDALAAVERQEGRGRWLGRSSVAVRGSSALRRGRVPDGLPPALAESFRPVEEHAHDRLVSRVRAPAVRLGKFDVDDEVRLRGFDPDRGIAYRLQGRADPNHAGIHRSIDARRQVQRHVPDLAPRLLAAGELGGAREGTAYLLEELIGGRHPADRGEVQDLLVPLCSKLARLQRAVGVGTRSLSAVVPAETRKRWSRAVEVEGIDPAVDEAVRGLFARDATLEVSLAHGDLVGSNILLLDDDVVLVDWEHAGTMPLAFDVAKPLLQARRPADALAGVRSILQQTIGSSTGSFRLEEQLALGHAQLVARSEFRRPKAEAAGRLEAYERDTARRLRVLAELLELA